MDADVIVVGAGPAGLLLAGDLAEAGVAVTVLERRDAQANLTRAFAVHARTLEELDARGVADELLATGQRVGELRLFGRVKVGLSGLPSRFPFLLVTPQYETERVLLGRAERAGARIERGVEVTALRQDATGVEVDVRGPDRAESTRRAKYLVGSDGVHSTVRHALGEPFPGHSAVRSVMLADVRLSQAPPDVLTVDTGSDGFAFIAPFGDGWYRVIAWDRRNQRPDHDPMDLDQVRDIVRRVLGTDLGMHDARWMSRFHSDERQAPHYRVGRVFLAGDAAHVHSPAGGQGMNTSLQDAANLGWRLAAAVRGWASEDVLDGYEAERHPVGRAVLRGSGGLLRAALLGNPAARWVRNTVLNAVLKLGPVVSRVAGAVSGVGIRYSAPRGAHRLVGARAADVALAGDGPGRLYEALRGGRFVLVTSASGDASERHGWRGPVTTVTPARPLGADLLVRPDGYIAWAADAS
ncbi:FAD-dependent monooxygenase [Pseudonocardia acaciae]|uniref:FAD-dependent monooxygenase n=1 Tax=Pseudonocardia acaciae TaxID=551276 RepID=UPI0006862EC4|nr:FAD-dependent monooxygenase [Pseudonocardia acaciae]